MMRIARFQLLGFVALCILSPALCLRFELQSGHTKCIAEDIRPNAMSVGKYSVVNPNAVEGQTPPPLPETHRVTVRVSSPHGNSLHYAENVELGNFAFVTSEDGDHLVCFWTPEHKPAVTLTVDFEWKSGIATKDWPKVAKKGQVEGMELELKKLEDTVQSIHDEMFYLRSREEEMQELNRTTNSRMAWLSFLSLGVCLSVAGLQLWHLKTFFERKKLL
ncbi:transmembrane emp24 domain-containing protein p24delta7-like [Wolffia australiana]